MQRTVAAVLAMMFAGTAAAQQQAAAPWPARAQAGTVDVGAEALVWWLRDSPAPVPLVTNRIVGLPDTQTYLGGQDLSTGATAGLRLTAGYALSDRSSIEGNFFFLPSRSTSRSVSSSGASGSTNLIVPYLDANTDSENGTEISYAPIYSGTAQEELSISLLGAEVNGAWALSAAAPWTVDVLGGFRYLRLKEDYTFTTSSPYIPPYPPGVWETNDKFSTTNNFYGLQAGLRARYDQGAFFGSGVVKVALGAMVQDVDISGSLVTDDFTTNGSTQTFQGGYFALPTNIGSRSRTAFSVVPEIGFNVGYRFTPTASLFLGYSFLYASNVVRPGNQIDRTINTTQSTAYTETPTVRLQGPARPSSSFNESNFWAQGINVGLAVRF